MIRMAFHFVLIVLIAAIGALYTAYGEISPCRTLAVEKARRANASTGDIPLSGGAIEAWARVETS